MIGLTEKIYRIHVIFIYIAYYVHFLSLTKLLILSAGGYCEWKLTEAAVKKADDGFIYQCFQQFREDLTLDCVPDIDYTSFEWTPTSSMPDTVYYQVNSQPSRKSLTMYKG